MSLTVSNLRVIDVAHYQTTAQVAAALPTVDGLIAKATEGLTSADLAGLGHAATARAAGKAVGFYHFGWLGSNVGAQVSWFLATAKPRPGDVLALDCEAYAKPQPGQWLSSSGARLSWVLAFIAGVNKATGARCWLYANRSELTALRNAATAAGRLKEFEAVPKWVADPDHPAGQPDVVGAWVCHQYSTAGGIDRDYFAGDYHSWTALGVQPAVKPAPAPVKPAGPSAHQLHVLHLRVLAAAAAAKRHALHLLHLAHIRNHPKG